MTRTQTIHRKHRLQYSYSNKLCKKKKIKMLSSNKNKPTDHNVTVSRMCNEWSIKKDK